jgi:DNA repair photolyase
MTIKSALHRLKRRGLPYQFDLNIYRGCSHGCVYCYGPDSHEYLKTDSFSSDIFIKTNLIEKLEKELMSPQWRGDIINIGGVCDSYQPLEKEKGIMRDILQLMIKYKNPVIISTKSDIILRDLDLIDRLAALTYVNLPICITSTDNSLTEKMEPGAPSPERRFATLKEVGKTRAHHALHFMPVLPFLSDDEPGLKKMVEWAAEAEVSYMLSGMLYLRGNIRKRYFSSIRRHFPHLEEKYQELYPKGSADPEYKSRIHGILKKWRNHYGVNNSYAKFLPKTV